MVEEQVEKTSVQKFKALGICEQLAEAAVALGWKTPTGIQEQAVPHLLQGQHLHRNMLSGGMLLTHACLRWMSWELHASRTCMQQPGRPP